MPCSWRHGRRDLRQLTDLWPSGLNALGRIASFLAVDEELEQAEVLPAAGDVSGLIRLLRATGETLPLGEIARLLAGAARLTGFDNLERAAAVVGGVRDGFRAGRVVGIVCG